MDLKSLNAFLHLRSTLHFSMTADAIHVSPPTLSRMIQRLEETFGYPLFKRDNRSVTLTAEGERFALFAQQVVSQWQALKHDVQQHHTQLSGELKIFCTVTAAHSFLPNMLERFHQQHPLVDIHLTTGDASLAIEKIAKHDVDIAIAARPDSLADKFAFQAIADIPLRIIAPTQHTAFSDALQGTEINWQALPFVMPEAGPARSHLMAWLKAMKLKPQEYAQVSGHEAIVSMVALGCGVSIAPDLVIENSPVKNKVRILPVPVQPQAFNLGLSCLKKQLNNPLVQAFWQLQRT
ncbi:HTH-type transcriptional activator IlvY [Flocculibacter collagenilyticus]|uniref:HTH-type transcriptional activator IlvY n=1 Tax=Flocculibacter collagenilyticus TaxID=2744479 RepID=UPI0018F74180|nr:HTH-type transcriptional activator IlvY [Flocculibacter collagenilyticus]